MTAPTNPSAILNGVPTPAPEASVSVFDRGFQFGDGCFETLAAVNGRVRDRAEHLERLGRGARLLGIPEPDSGQLADELAELCPAEGRAVLKVIYTRGSGGRGLAPPDEAVPTRVVLRLPWPQYPAEHWTQGVRVRLCETRQIPGRSLDGRIKHLNQLNRITARMEWEGGDPAEGLMRDLEGRVLEGTVTNLFVVQGGTLLTPDLGRSGLPGIIRGRVLTLAQEAGWGVAEGEVTPAELGRGDEVFLTNSLIGIWPVRGVNDLGVAWPAPGPVTEHLQQLLESSYG
jgi:4-amino-4-deoxychorismate lyase